MLNDPVNYIDPDGRHPLAFIAAGAVLGAAAGGKAADNRGYHLKDPEFWQSVATGTVVGAATGAALWYFAPQASGLWGGYGGGFSQIGSGIANVGGQSLGAFKQGVAAADNLLASTKSAYNSVAGLNNMTSTSSSNPYIFINLNIKPKGFNRQEFTSLLKQRLIDNGFSQNLNVEYWNLGNRIKSWWNNSPTANITIKNFRLGKDPLDASGYSVPGSNEGVVYNGLSPKGSYQTRSLPTWNYVNASMHELGHAIFKFSHTAEGFTNDPSSIMDYRSNYLSKKIVNFNKVQQSIIRKSIWGR